MEQIWLSKGRDWLCMIQLGVVIKYLNQPGVEIEKVYYAGGAIRNIKCVGDLLFKLKLIGT